MCPPSSYFEGAFPFIHGDRHSSHTISNEIGCEKTGDEYSLNRSLSPPRYYIPSGGQLFTVAVCPPLPDYTVAIVDGSGLLEAIHHTRLIWQ